MTLYFAYGSNLSKAAMRKRAPSAQPLIAAVLPEHQLVFESNEPLRAPDAFFANVRPAVSSCVHGALYAVDAAVLNALDAYEEVARGVYERKVLHVLRADGKAASALIYRMPLGSSPRARSGLPSMTQLAQIRRGYADWGLDARALAAALESVRAKIS